MYILYIMVDRYWRKIVTVKDSVANSLQISSILLKLKGYDEKLSEIDTTKTNISANLTKIKNNETNISSIENNMNIKIKKDIYENTFIISNMTTNSNSKKIADIYVNSNFTTDGIIKINANYNYSYNGNNFSHIYKFLNNNQKFKEIKLEHKSKVINDKFNIPATNSTRINLLIYLVNNDNDNSPIELFDYNTIKITYNDNVDILKLDVNTDNISNNLSKIEDNTTNISNNLEKVNTNKNDISNNLEKINSIKNDISNNLEKNRHY